MELQELAGRIRNGDKNALKELIAAYGSDVYKNAYSKTKDPDLAREATRRTFAQFVASLQDQSGADGWRLWLDALAGKNIDSFRRVSTDVDWVGKELDSELFRPDAPDASDRSLPPPRPQKAAAPARPTPGRTTPVRSTPARGTSARATPGRGIAQPSRPITERTAGQKKTRSERLFPTGPVSRKKKRGGNGAVGILLLFLLCVLLIWMVLGLAMSLGWLPRVDIGYQWFNETLFPFFYRVIYPD